MHRTVEPEILDHLAPGDPEAIRSRRDLRLIHSLMGNERWILRSLGPVREAALERGVTEFGAGDGKLAARLLHALGDARIECMDLAPRPAGLDRRIHWRQGDLLEHAPENRGLLVASLFLHHFQGDALLRLGQWCGQFQAFRFTEPLRSRLALAQGKLLFPAVNRVTRHDMITSIRAGFVKGELQELLGLESGQWQIEEKSTLRGGLRIAGWRL